jgi:hypothetical protein
LQERGREVATGILDKNIIRRHIRLRLAHIKNCYEKELLAQPHLAAGARKRSALWGCP